MWSHSTRSGLRIPSTCPRLWPPPFPLCPPLQLLLITLASFLTPTPGTSYSASKPPHCGSLCRAKYTQICAGLSPFPATGILNVIIAGPFQTHHLVEFRTQL